MTSRIAFLEDDPDQSALVMRWLEKDGHRCLHFTSGGAFLEGLAGEKVDLAILDWTLPDMTGEQAMAGLMAMPGPRPPIIFVTANDDPADVVRVLRAGADDYMRKPVMRDELLPRVRAYVASGAAASGAGQVLSWGPNELDRAAGEFRRNGAPIALSDVERQLALTLFECPGRLVPCARLLEAVPEPGEDAERQVESTLGRLRGKLGLSPANGWRFGTVFGYGYRLEPMRPRSA